MKNTLILSIALLSIFWACQQPEAQKEFTGERQFRTTEPSRLYFNNIRSSNYYQEQQTNRTDVYRFRKFSNTANPPLLSPVIVNNWLEDEAYILFEKNEFDPGFSDTLTVKWTSSSDSGFYHLPLPNWENQYQFAGQLYESLQKNHELSIKTSAKKFIPLLENKSNQQHFRTVINDYYRLTEVY